MASGSELNLEHPPQVPQSGCAAGLDRDALLLHLHGYATAAPWRERNTYFPDVSTRKRGSQGSGCLQAKVLPHLAGLLGPDAIGHSSLAFHVSCKSESKPDMSPEEGRLETNLILGLLAMCTSVGLTFGSSQSLFALTSVQSPL